jgi:hypothetical protein
MVIDALYRKYFQKSKIFLYPILGIKRGTSVVPTETYVSWADKVNSEDMKLVCVYPVRTDSEYMQFEKNVLLKHNRLIDLIKVDEEKLVVTFNFSDLSDDWSCFLDGKYSKMNINTKRKILDFFDKKSGNYAYVESYLFPEKHFETYAKILDVDANFLKSVGELCNKPDLDKESLLIEVADLENIKIIQ